jgi:predicted DNA-binding transcriptional regulator AlpA
VDIDTLRKFASTIDCLIEEDFYQFVGITPLTAKAWRNRGKAPQPVLIGTRYFYPLAAIRQIITNRTKDESTKETEVFL